MENLLFLVEQYRLEDSVGYLLSRSRARLAKALDAALLEHDITHSQAGVLLLLASGNYTTAAELVREIYTDAASMARMLDRMQKRGFVAKFPDTGDRRQQHLRLTEEGAALAAQLPLIMTTVLNTQFEGFSAEEIGFLKSLLRKFLSKE